MAHAFSSPARLSIHDADRGLDNWKFGESFTGFLKSVYDAKNGNREEQNAARVRLEKVYGTGYISLPMAKSAMGEVSGTVGGYLVPPAFTATLMRTIEEESIIYPRANIIPMESSIMECPMVDVTTAQSTGTSPFFGGINYTWGNSQAPTETEPTLRAMELRAWDLLGYAKISNQMLMDMGAAGEYYLIRLFGRAAAWYAEYAFFQGTGTAAQMPLGILNAPAAVTVSRKTGSQINTVDIAGMAAALLPFSWKRAIWAASPTCIAQVVQLTNFFLNVEPHKEGGQAGSLLTRPLFITEKLAALGTQGDFVLFDPSLYVIGNRMEAIIDVSHHALFQTNQTEFRIWMRMDGKCQVPKSVTLADGSTVVSPIVVLK